MNLKQLEYFLRVAELGSFTRASMVLDVSQPSVSRQVRLLEVSLRQTLLHRNGRGVELTDAGRCLLEHGLAIERSVQKAQGALDELRSDPRGRIVVGLPSRVARVLTTHLVKSFRSRYPHASITVAEGSSSVLHEWLVLGRVNIALLFAPTRSSELQLEGLHTERLVLVGPSRSPERGTKSRESRVSALGHTVTLKELRRFPLILPRRPNATRSVLEAAVAAQRVSLNVTIEVDTIENILDLVAGRMGYAVLPEGAVQGSGGDRFSVAPIGPPELHQELFLAQSRHNSRNRLATEVRRIIRAAGLPRRLGSET